MTNKFHNNKFGIIQIGVEALSQTQILIHPNNSFSQIQNQKTKYKPKNQRFIDTKYQMRTAHKLKREPQIKSKSYNAPRKSKSPNRRTKTKRQQTSLNIPNCNPQISNNQMKREPFSHTLSSFSLIFCSSTILI